jgi:hypothetical protein
MRISRQRMNSASNRIIGSGIPISHNNAPLPNDMRMNVRTKTPNMRSGSREISGTNVPPPELFGGDSLQQDYET